MRNITPDYKERQEILSNIEIKYPFSERGLVARSILGRDIDYIKIGSGKKHVVSVGAHHGMEYITSLALFDFIEFISEKLTRCDSYCGIDIEFLLQKFTFWIIPCLNPDGVELCLCGASDNPLKIRQIKMNGGENFSDWQANGRGVDLNHNYNYGFSEYKNYEALHGIVAGRGGYSGEYPESEPETRGLIGFINTLNPSLIVSLHSQGREIYSMPENAYMHRLSERIASDIGYIYAKPEGSAKYGGLTDFCGGVLGIPSFTVELGKGKNPLPLSALPEICGAVRKLLVLLPTYL